MNEDFSFPGTKDLQNPSLLTRLSWFTGLFWFPWLLISGLLVSVLLALGYVNHEMLAGRACEQNLRSLYAAFELYELDKGNLPKLAFYPTSPVEGQDSLMTVLRPYGVKPGYCVCPKSPEIVRSAGLSYIWNVALNTQPLPDKESTVWMLMEIQALSDKIPGPHLRGYQTLYTDGRIERSGTVPPGI